MKKRKIQSGSTLSDGFDRIENKIDGIIDDLKGMASKDDLKGMASKDDLKSMASKDDLKSMASKDDLDKAMSKMVTIDHFDYVIGMMVTKVEFDDFKEYVVENMYTKADHSKFLDILDVMGLEFKNTQQSNILTGKQLCDMDDKINGFDKRLRVLEQKI